MQSVAVVPSRKETDPNLAVLPELKVMGNTVGLDVDDMMSANMVGAPFRPKDAMDSRTKVFGVDEVRDPSALTQREPVRAVKFLDRTVTVNSVLDVYVAVAVCWHDPPVPLYIPRRSVPFL